MLEPGTVIAGKLRIERVLGRGGMGVVAEATHLQLEQRVAVKVMLDRVAGDPDTVERFMREARAAAKLKSEHVCRVSDVGQLDSGAPYIVMELLAGTDLAHLLAQGPLAIPTAVDYVLQACIAIAEAHVHGIVHRDLKPANLFLTKHVGGAPLVKVLDFGIAKDPSKAAAGITATESVMGSPGYMSPEQLRSSRDVDARTDIWALGVILYQLVSQRLPFPAASVTELAVKVAMDPPDPLEGDPAFVTAVMRCLEKEPAARFANVLAFATAFAPLGTDSARRSLAVIEQLAPKADSLASTMPAVDVDAPTVAPSPKTVTTLGGAASVIAAPVSAPRRRTGLYAGIGVVALGGVAAIVLSSGGDPAKPAVAPAAGSAAAPARKPTVAELLGKFDNAVVAQRCLTATELSEELKLIAAKDQIADVQHRLGDCLNKQASVFENLAAPDSINTIHIQAQELAERGQYEGALGLVDIVLRVDPKNEMLRSFGLRTACEEGFADGARMYAKGLSSAAISAAGAACVKRGFDLAKRADTEWANEADTMMLANQHDLVLDQVLPVLARDPADQRARKLATITYCRMNDAANARKMADKLDASVRAKVQKDPCDQFKIDLSAK